MDAITWPSEFLEFWRCCERHGARLLVFGGFAVSLHARPRTTGDLDLWCGMAAENWDRVKRALVDFGFDAGRVDAIAPPTADLLVRFGYEPVRIELFASVADLDFEDCWSKRVDIDAGGLRVSFLDRDSLIRSKVAAGRPQDLADLDTLRRTMPP
jgi:predicted nucleotidyltransferase